MDDSVLNKPALDDPAVDLPEFHDVVEAGFEFEKRLRTEGPSAPLLDDARSVMRDAIRLGAVIWDLNERDELDGIAMRAAGALEDAGEPVEDVTLAPFAGEVPTYRALSRAQFEELISADKPVIGRNIRDQDLTGIDLTEARIMDCALHNCILSGANLTGARLLHTIFDRCDFDGATLTNAVVTSCLIRGRTRTEDSNGGAGFSDVTACDANFSGSRLEYLTLSNRPFERALFSNSYLYRIVAGRGTSLNEAVFDLATLEHVDFRETKLCDALFIGSELIENDLRDAVLERAVFSSAKVGSSDFRGALLTGTSFRSAYFVGQARFDGRTVCVTEEDLKAGRVGISRDGTGKLLPPQRSSVGVNLRGTMLSATWDPVDGDGDLAGVLEFDPRDLDLLADANDIMAVQAAGDKISLS